MNASVYRNEISLKTIAVFLIVTTLSWSFGFYMLARNAHAAALTSVSDTLSTSNRGSGANHSIQYTNPTSTNAGETISVTFDPTTNLFGGFSTLLFADLSFTGMTLTSACSGAASEVTWTSSSSNVQVFTVCATDTVASGTKTLAFNNAKITNPTTTGSYVIRIDGSQANSADTRIAIVDNITMTAAVDTSLTFTITATTTGNINGDATGLIASTTTTTIPFNTLAPGVAKAAGHILTVSTNARNGFIVTLQQNQNLLSSTGADIDLFADGASTSVPVVWKTPSSTLDVENTYGHYGVTSEDSDLNAGEFTGTKYAGNIGTPRTVFSHTGPADGATPDKGKTKVAVKIEIGPLQEAGNDYTNQLTYVCTPTF